MKTNRLTKGLYSTMDMDTIYPVNPDTLNKWEECCDAGRMAREQIDHWKFYIGDLACRIVTLFVKNPDEDLAGVHTTLKRFAIDINEKYGTIAQRRQVSMFYPDSTRVEFMESHRNITWTHMRDAMRLKDVNLAYAFLRTANDAELTTDQALCELSDRGASSGTQTRYKGYHRILAIQDDTMTIDVKNDAFGDLRKLVGMDVEITIKELD